VVALVAVALFLFVGNRYFGELHTIAQASWPGVIGMAAVYIATLWLQSRTVKCGLDAFGHRIGEKENFSLFVAGSAINLVLPRSGIGSTALYLSRMLHVPLFDYGSVVLYNVALFVFCSSLTGVAAFSIEWAALGQAPPLWLIWLLPIALLGSGMAITVRWSLPGSWQFAGCGLARRLVRATRRLNGSPQMRRMARTHLILVFLRALRLQIAFWALGVPAGFLPVLMASVLGDLMFVIAVTPGAIGFRETAIALAAGWLGTTVPVALAVTLLDRLVFSLTVVILAQFAWRVLLREPLHGRDETLAENAVEAALPRFGPQSPDTAEGMARRREPATLPLAAPMSIERDSGVRT
jgi:uncharacterized membrane protein YbhN (UPF0104 family)